MGTSTSTRTVTMQAVVQDGYGPVDVLRLAEADRPGAADRQVLVRVAAAGLNRSTWHLMTGRPWLLRLAFGVRRPRQPIAGRDVAGTVVQVGAAVTRFAVGDRVFGIGSGAFAEYATGPEDKLAHLPDGIGFAEAAALPVSGLTALQALRDAGRIEAGQRVLVIGASGGVGSLAVQIAKAYGAEVTGVCSAVHLDAVRSAGADHVVDYRTEDVTDGRRQFDLVLDLAGNRRLSRLRRALTPVGAVVLAGGEGGNRLTGGTIGRQLHGLARTLTSRQRFVGLLCKERAADLVVLADLVVSGAVRPVIDRVHPLADVPLAMRRLADGAVVGGIVIGVDGGAR
jgi:NADPH:quinone reductase-like Zn-dependent oxidoreductase